MSRKRLIEELIQDEGLRLKPYVDTVGKVTIGIGRNLTDKGITEEEARYLLKHDIEQAEVDLDDSLPWWRRLDFTRQRVLLNMTLNLGIGSSRSGKGLLGFVNTLVYLERGDYEAAARGMLASLWAKQVGARAERLAEMMRTGTTEGDRNGN